MNLTSDLKRKQILFLPPALCLKEFKCDFKWRPSHLCSAREWWDAGPCKWPSTFSDFKNRCWSSRTICTKKRTCIYVMYIYKDITNTQWVIIFFFLVWLGLQVWLKGWLTSVYALIVKQNDWSATLCCCTDVMKWRIFTSEIQNHCPETGQCGLLMYINQMCSMVVFWSWFIIGLNCIRYQKLISTRQMCGFVWSLNTLWGAHWPISQVEPASLVQSFHVKFNLSFWNVWVCWLNGLRTLSCLIISQVLCLHVCLSSRETFSWPEE